MKKIFKALGILIVVIIVLLVAMPFLFKGKIAEMIQQQMDDHLNARVELADLDLSLISTFPDFKLELKGVKVTGKAQYEGIVLADIGLIETHLDLMSVINGDQMKIKSVGIADANFHVIVDVIEADTLANYDIVKSSGETVEEEVEEVTAEESAPFSMSVSSYYLRNINVIYDDRVGDMYAEIKNFTHEGSGDFTLDNFLLETQTNIEELTFKMEGMRYMKKAKFDIKFDTEIDMVNSKYTFKENHFGINELMLHFEGYVALPDEKTTELDLTFNTEKTTFKSVLSLIPAVYMTDFESIKTDGNFSLDGMAKGKMIGNDLPAFNLNLKVDNGRFQYPDLPKSAENINIDLNVKNPGGSDDNTVVNLKNFHVELADNPIDMRMLVKTPVSDADIDGNIKMDIDLASLADVMPSENGEDYKGKVTADINLKGKVSTLEAEDYENFDASGSMILEGIVYNDPSLGYPVQLNKADFQFTPQAIEMAELNCLLGKSDINGTGTIANYISYAFSDGTLKGLMAINSNLMDLNELAGPEEESSEVSEGEESSETEETENESAPVDSSEGAVEVPGNIDFVLTSNFKKVLYDNMEMTDMIGKITVRDQKVAMENLDMNMLGGSLNMNGFYETTNLDKPNIDFKMAIKKFDVPQTYTTFNTVKEMAPIAENATGSFSTAMTLVCVLDGNMEPIYESMNGGGDLQTHMVKISDSETLNKVADALKKDDLRTLVLNDVNITYEFREGRVWVEPFDMKLGDLNANVSGSNGFDQTLDYLIKTAIPMDALGAGAGMAKGLMDQFNQQAGTNASLGDEVKVDVKVTGTNDKPRITPSFGSGSGDAKAQAKDELKKKAKEEIDKLKKEAEAKAKAEADRLKKEVEAQARQEVDKIKKEAEAKAKAEGDRLKKEVEAKAKAEAEKVKKKAAEELKKKGEDKLKKLIGR
ncbi:MAG: AsmA-like C-terminal region-containing protein [Salibacteraceae bacterium]|nr:AsmA-like C-terminal region-containing protein [Salibacteraceae bacterium]